MEWYLHSLDGGFDPTGLSRRTFVGVPSDHV